MEKRSDSLAPAPASPEEGLMKAIGVAGQGIAREIGEKNVEVEKIGLERDKVAADADTKRHLISSITVCAVLAAMLVFAGYALAQGTEGSALAADVVKVGLGALLGGFGGWGLRASREKDK